MIQAAIHNPSVTTRIRIVANALMSGETPRRTFENINMGSVVAPGPDTKLAITKSSMDDLVIASFVSGPGATTLPMLIFSKVRLGVSPDINALATILILVVTLGLCIAAWITSRQNRSLS